MAFRLLWDKSILCSGEGGICPIVLQDQTVRERILGLRFCMETMAALVSSCASNRRSQQLLQPHSR